MIESLKDIQLDLMLVLCGISAAAAFFMALSKSLDKERKIYLILANLFSVLLLHFDRAAYVYRGDEILISTVKKYLPSMTDEALTEIFEEYGE